MKLTIDRIKLTDVVTHAVRAVPQRAAVPVLAGLKLAAEDGTLTVSGYDYELSIEMSMAADVAASGTVVVPGRLLANICKQLGGDTVELKQTKKRMTLTCGSARFTLHTLPDDEYPELPTMPPETVKLPGQLLHEAISQVATAAGRDDTLPVLTGIQMVTDPKAKTTTFAATDRYRIAVRAVPVDLVGDGADHKTLVPAKMFADAVKAVSDDVSVKLATPPDAVIGVSGDGGLSTTLRLLDGELPNYTKLIPTEFDASATVETAPLKEAVKRAALVAERNTPVRFHFDPLGVLVEAGSSDDATAREEVDGELDGDEFDIAFNPGFFLEGLEAIGSEKIQINANGPTKPALLSDAEAPNDTTDGVDYTHLKYLIMPVRLNG